MKTHNRLVIVLGDQLSLDLLPFEDFDLERDAVWMAEVTGESTRTWSSKQRTALFLSAMRHFRQRLIREGFTVYYEELEEGSEENTLGGVLGEFLSQDDFSCSQIVVTQPGEYSVLEELKSVCHASEYELEVLEDSSFVCSSERFNDWASGRKQLRMEYFYREMRRDTNLLMDDGKPEGGKWNFDKKNRGSFGKKGPQDLPAIKRFAPDQTTREVIELVNRLFLDHPGKLDTFAWPVTKEDAELALQDYLEKGLANFGRYQDAMWQGEPFLFHSLVSAALNLKLISPLEVARAVEQRYLEGLAPIEAAEGYIRQVIGWREYVRGVYWMYMPEYSKRNYLQAKNDLPGFYWTGQTSMNCMRSCVEQTLEYGYAHHIQRLMVTGLFSLLWGTEPDQIHQWYLAVYVDAVEWVELPNTVGMSQYADNGVMASKPYVATGKYIDRMSNYCGGCRYDPGKRLGKDACPFTTMYWEFLIRHEEILKGNQRMGFQLKNVKQLSDEDRNDILQQAKETRATLSVEK